MRSLNKAFVDKEVLFCSSADSRCGVAPSGFMPRLAKLDRHYLVSRSRFLLSVTVCLLLLCIAQPLWAKPGVTCVHVQLGSTSSTSMTLPPVSVGLLGSPPIRVFTFGTENLDFILDSATSCNAGGNCSVVVQFLPTAPGFRGGAAVIYDDDNMPAFILPLCGIGDAPMTALSPGTTSVIGTGTQTTNNPKQIAIDGAGNMYVGNSTDMDVVQVPTGGGAPSVMNTGLLTLGNVAGVALDGAGNLFISDNSNSQIVVVMAPLLPQPMFVNAYVLSISGLTLNAPGALAFDALGNLYIGDQGNNRVVKVGTLTPSPGGISGAGTVIATPGFSLGNPGNGGALGVAASADGTVVYIADGFNNRVIQVATGAASLLVPSGITPLLNGPQGVSVDGMGNVYIADSGNNRIVQVTTAGIASVVQMLGLPIPSALNSPSGVAVDTSGNIFIPDSNNNRIVEVNVSGASLAFANTTVGSTSGDSPQTATVTNLGNQALVFSASPTYTASFSENNGDTNVCTSSTSLSAGTVCDVSVKFTPQSVGSLKASITLTDNALNAPKSTQQVSVSGTGLAPPVIDFTIGVSAGSAASVTVTAGGAAGYALAVSPIGSSTFTSVVTFTVSGLPTGATATFTPPTLPAGSSATNVTLTIYYSGQTATLHRNSLHGYGLALLMVGVLLLPFGGRIRRAASERSRQAFLLVLVLAGTGAMAGLMGCSGSTTSGYLVNQQQTYAVTVTATSGSVSHSTNVSLTVH